MADSCRLFVLFLSAAIPYFAILLSYNILNMTGPVFFFLNIGCRFKFVGTGG